MLDAEGDALSGAQHYERSVDRIDMQAGQVVGNRADYETPQ